MSDTEKIKLLEEKVEFLLKVCGFHTGYLEALDPSFKKFYKEYFGDENE